MSSTSPPESPLGDDLSREAGVGSSSKHRAWYWAFVIWAAAILVLYPLLRVEDARVVVTALMARLLDVAVPLFLVALHLAPAHRIVRACGLGGIESLRLILPLGLSIVLIMGWATTLSFLGPGLPYWLFQGALLGAPVLAAGVFRREYLPLAEDLKNALRSAATVARSIPGAVISCVLFLGLVMTLTPATSLDALHYHLTVPKVWLESGGVCDLPGNIYSRFPMNTEMLYLVAMAWRGEISAKVFHWLLGVFSALAIFRVAGRFATPAGACWSAAIFLAVPTVFRVGTWAYVELAGVFFLMLAWLLYLEVRRDGPRSLAVLCGLCVGVAVGTKYTFLLPAAFVVLLLARKGGVRVAGLAALAACCGGGAWYLRNLIELGNPVFPFLHAQLGGAGWDAGRSALFMESLKEWGSRGSQQPLALPFALTFEGMFGSVPRFDGIVGPAYLLSLPLVIAAVVCRRHARSTGLLGLLLLGSWVATTHQIRFLVPALAVMAVLIPAGWEALPDLRQRRAARGLVMGALVLCLTSHLMLFSTLAPVPFVLGLESKEAHLTRVIQPGDYPLFQELNARVAADDLVLVAACGAPRYLIDRPYHADSVIENHTLRKLLADCPDPLAFAERFWAAGFTHIVFHLPLVLGDGSDLPIGERRLLQQALNRHGTLLADHEGTYLFALPRPDRSR